MGVKGDVCPRLLIVWSSYSNFLWEAMGETIFTSFWIKDLISESVCFAIYEFRLLPLGAGLSKVVTETVCAGYNLIYYRLVVSWS